MKCSPAHWGRSWITNNQGETSSDGKKQGQNYYQLNITFFFVQGKQQKCSGGERVFSFIVEKQRGSVFAGNWPRLQTSINQRHARAPNKDTAVVTLQQICYFQLPTSSYIMTALPSAGEQHSPLLDLPLYVRWHWAAHGGGWKASTSGPPSTTLSSNWGLYETEQIAFWKWKALCLNKMSLKSFQREIRFSHCVFNPAENISDCSNCSERTNSRSSLCKVDLFTDQFYGSEWFDKILKGQFNPENIKSIFFLLAFVRFISQLYMCVLQSFGEISPADFCLSQM